MSFFAKKGGHATVNLARIVRSSSLLKKASQTLEQSGKKKFMVFRRKLGGREDLVAQLKFSRPKALALYFSSFRSRLIGNLTCFGPIVSRWELTWHDEPLIRFRDGHLV